MEPSIKQSLQNASYEARRKASLAYEPVLREMASAGTPESEHKLRVVITQLVELAGSKVHASRSGGIMGLASTAIALGPRLADYLGALIMPVLACFEDHDSKIRYYACESMYNIAKVAHGEILVYFNELFDALSKLAADPEVSVKNGAELLDRQLKDIVQDQAALYISRANYGDDYSPDVYPDGHHPHPVGPEKDHASSRPQPQRAFSLPRFIPLLHERLSVLNPFTRTFLISWLLTLDQVPDLELITFLPDFLDGLLRYLGDPTDEVRCSTESLLEDLLREIREARKQQLEALAARREAWERDGERRRRRRASEVRTVTVGDTDGDGDEGDGWNGKGTPTPRTLAEHDDDLDRSVGEDALGDSEDDDEYPLEGDGSAEWLPGQGVHIEYGAIVEILVQHLSFPDEEIQATCLHWISQFLTFVPGVVVPFAPRLIPVILSALAHHVEEIQQAASDTNDLLFAVIQALPVDGSSAGGVNGSNGLSPASAADFSPPHTSLSTVAFAPNVASPPPSSIPFPSTSSAATPRPGHDRHKPGSDASSLLHAPSSALAPLSPSSDSSSAPQHLAAGSSSQQPQGLGLALAYDFADPLEPDAARFAYGQTVNELTLQFLSDNEETRVAALEWLLMLHQKAPRKILAGDDPSLSSRRDRPSTQGAAAAARSTSRQRNPSASSTSSGLSLAVLLKLLSDSSERVLRYDLQLLAQISSLGSGPGAGVGVGGRGAAAGGDDEYFAPLMSSLLELFSTDRKLLETRGSLIIRQLCGSLNAERIYRTCAEILEKDEDLEFASVMVQNLNLIMITSPELSEFRKRLRTLDSKDGQNLFVTLYRSWSHNAVATFTLCLLAQAYEQASALLQIFADLEMTVPMLIQIDKLVQLIESPVFTSLRLQLLEPERHPYLLKAMYGLLMLLPQSSAFATLRNRLSAVSSLGFLQTVPRASLISPPHRTTTPLSSTLSGPSPSSSGPGSSSNPTLSSLARTRADAATPDPPSIRWTELLAHFRGVQKRRQAAASPARAVGGAAAAGQGAAAAAAAAVGDSVSPRAEGDVGGAGGAGAAAGAAGAGSRLVGTAAAGRRRPTGPAHSSASGSGFVRAADTASVGSSSVQSGRGGGGGGGAGRLGGAGGGPGAAGLRALSPPLVGTAGAKRRVQGGPGGGGAGGGAGAGAGSRRM
ncbi:hypothetical protein JCM8208_006895 [Rhodotorula glutinis]